MPSCAFRSESPDLARLCNRHGINFVGPSVEILEQLAEKTADSP